MKRTTVIILLSLALAVNCWATEKTYGNATVSKLESIYDGDTITVTINSWPVIIGDHIEIRVKGVDTPEMKGKCESEIQLANKARDFTVNFLSNNKKIYLKNMSRDKYFRIDADVYVDGKSLTEQLIANNLGYPYTGGTKRSWCS